MEFTYHKAQVSDLELLTTSRIEVLRAANQLNRDIDMSLIEQQTYEYYKESLSSGRHTAYLVFDGPRFIGAGGVSFFRVMPTYHNPTGDKAYIMNMYTLPEYRRKGIAYKTLDLLVAEARARGISHISLEATQMGKQLYERYGFIAMEDEMILPAAFRAAGRPPIHFT